MDALLAMVDARLTSGARSYELILPASAGRQLAWLHQHGHVVSEVPSDRDGKPSVTVTVRLTPKEYGRFHALAAEG